MSAQEHTQQDSSVITVLGVLIAIVMSLHLLINVAAKPWGWPQGSVEYHESFAADGEAHGGHH